MDPQRWPREKQPLNPRRGSAPCPKCSQSDRVVAITYGYVNPTIAPDAVLGGCCIEPDSPAWFCHRCKRRFGRLGDRE